MTWIISLILLNAQRVSESSATCSMTVGSGDAAMIMPASGTGLCHPRSGRTACTLWWTK